jgi:Trk K+ transport system NAD-binding subunit
MTVFCQGLSAGWVAKWLKIASTEATGAVIVGCNPLSLLVARLFLERGESVAIIDTDPLSRKQAEAENIPFFLSSALDPEVLEEAGLSSMGTFIAMTSNGEVNFVLAQRAAEEFKPPRVLAVFPRDPVVNNGNNPLKINQAFLPELEIKTWNDYLTDGRVKLGITTLMEAGFAFQQAHLQALTRAGELVPLLIEREGRSQIVSASDEWIEGDRIIYLLHDPRPLLLKRLSGERQLSRLTLEKLAAVEEVPITS